MIPKTLYKYTSIGINLILLALIIYFSSTLFFSLGIAWVISIAVFEVVKLLAAMKAKGVWHGRKSFNKEDPAVCSNPITTFIFYSVFYLICACVSIVATVGSAGSIIEQVVKTERLTSSIEKESETEVSKINARIVTYENEIKSAQDRKAKLSSEDDWSLRYFTETYNKDIANNQAQIDKLEKQKQDILNSQKGEVSKKEEKSNPIAIMQILGRIFRVSPETAFYFFRLLMLIVLEISLVVTAEPLVAEAAEQKSEQRPTNFGRITCYVNDLFKFSFNERLAITATGSKQEEYDMARKFLKMTCYKGKPLLEGNPNALVFNYSKEETIAILQKKESLLNGSLLS
jgi:hypothetical protein